MCNPILQLRARTTKIWTAVVACRGEAQRRLERSGDTAFRATGCFQKRRGASLPAAVQNPWWRRKPRWVNPCPSVVKFPDFGIRATVSAERLEPPSIRSSVARCRIPGRTLWQIAFRSWDRRPVFQMYRKVSGICRNPRRRRGGGRLCRPGRQIRRDAAHWPRGPARGPVENRPSS
jgi:hypothetical protein